MISSRSCIVAKRKVVKHNLFVRGRLDLVLEINAFNVLTVNVQCTYNIRKHQSYTLMPSNLTNGFENA